MEKVLTVQGYQYSLMQGTQHESWLEKTRLKGFAKLPWAAASQNFEAQEQLMYLLQERALPLKSNCKVMLHPKLLTVAFRLPDDGIVAAPELEDSEMAKIFGPKEAKESKWKLCTMNDFNARHRYEWFLEKVILLLKSSYMSKRAYAVLLRAEHGEHVNWAHIIYDTLVTRLNSLQKSGGRIKLSAHLHFLFQYSLAHETGPEGTLSLKGYEPFFDPHAIHMRGKVSDSTSSKKTGPEGTLSAKGYGPSFDLHAIHTRGKVSDARSFKESSPEATLSVKEKRPFSDPHAIHMRGRISNAAPSKSCILLQTDLEEDVKSNEKSLFVLGEPRFCNATNCDQYIELCLGQEKLIEEPRTTQDAKISNLLHTANISTPRPIFIDATTCTTGTGMKQETLIESFNGFRQERRFSKANQDVAPANHMRKVGLHSVSTLSPISLAQKVEVNLKLGSSKLHVVERTELTKTCKMSREAVMSEMEACIDYTPEQLQNASLVVAKGANMLTHVQRKCSELTKTLHKEHEERKSLEEECKELQRRLQMLESVKEQKQEPIDAIVESKLLKLQVECLREEKEKYVRDALEAYKKRLQSIKGEAEKVKCVLRDQYAKVNMKNIELQGEGKRQGHTGYTPTKTEPV